MKPTEPQQKRIFDELVSHDKQDDISAPARDNGYWYYTRRVIGGEHSVLCRKKDAPDAIEETLLDGNAMAKDQAYFAIGGYAISDDNRLLAYTIDLVGRRQWTLHFKDLRTGTTLPDAVANVDSQVEWAADSQTVLYVEKDPVTLLSTRVKRHALGADPKADPTLYEEKDHAFYLGVERTRSKRLLLIVAQSTVSTEVWTARANDPALAFSVVIPRERDHEYSLEDLGDRLVLRTNWKAKNFRIVEVPAKLVADRERWRDVVPHRDDAFVEGFLTFRDFIAVAERSGGLAKVRVKRWGEPASRVIAADEPAYTARLGTNWEVASPSLRYEYTSLTTPETTYDYDVVTGEKALVKRHPVLGGFDPQHYTTEYLHVPTDGVEVPVSLVYRKTTPRDGTAPLFQEGYGSYGLSEDPMFREKLLPLLDRGFVFAIAHVRGGQELGRRWYEDGKLLHKKNTFDDFIAVTDYLTQHGYGAKDRVVAHGGSAGGLLMGAIANLAPNKYRVIVADVPFVDVVTTMLDESIPLTRNELDEWGNPKNKDAYDYMLSYSPYDNVRAQAYPAMLVTTGLWDSQVQYYEPAKWVARLRARKTDQRTLLLKTNMDAGHGGKSGRFQRLRELAFEYAFILDQLGRH